jgi:hypothetical protein
MLLRSIAFVKSVHIVIGIALTGGLAVLLYDVIVDKITIQTWIAHEGGQYVGFPRANPTISARPRSFPTPIGRFPTSLWGKTHIVSI